MAYEFKNSKGQNYLLHSKTVTLRGSGKQQTIYFFTREPKPSGAVNDIPSGYKVLELKTGLPVLQKS